MEHKKSFNSIADKLDRLNEIPQGISFNAAGVWQKFEAALHPPKKKKMAARYYVAAGLAIFILLVIFIDRTDLKKDNAIAIEKNLPLPGKTAVQPQDIKPPIKAVEEKNISTIPVAGSSKKTIHLFPAADKIKIPDPFIPQQIARHQLPDQLPINEITAKVSITPTVQIASTSPTMAAAKPILKVMHINELGNTITKPPQKTESGNTLLLFTRSTEISEFNTAEFEQAIPAKQKAIFKATPGFQNN